MFDLNLCCFSAIFLRRWGLNSCSHVFEFEFLFCLRGVRLQQVLLLRKRLTIHLTLVYPNNRRLLQGFGCAHFQHQQQLLIHRICPRLSPCHLLHHPVLQTLLNANCLLLALHLRFIRPRRLQLRQVRNSKSFQLLMLLMSIQNLTCECSLIGLQFWFYRRQYGLEELDMMPDFGLLDLPEVCFVVLVLQAYLLQISDVSDGISDLQSSNSNSSSSSSSSSVDSLRRSRPTQAWKPGHISLDDDSVLERAMWHLVCFFSIECICLTGSWIYRLTVLTRRKGVRHHHLLLLLQILDLQLMTVLVCSLQIRVHLHHLPLHLKTLCVALVLSERGNLDVFYLMTILICSAPCDVLLCFIKINYIFCRALSLADDKSVPSTSSSSSSSSFTPASSRSKRKPRQIVVDDGGSDLDSAKYFIKFLLVLKRLLRPNISGDLVTPNNNDFSILADLDTEWLFSVLFLCL